jgi:hypothetical protein
MWALLGNMEWAPLLGTHEEKINRDIRIKRDVKMPCKWVSLSIGAPLGNLEGIRLLGLFERKGLVYLVSLLGPRGH